MRCEASRVCRFLAATDRGKNGDLLADFFQSGCLRHALECVQDPLFIGHHNFPPRQTRGRGFVGFPLLEHTSDEHSLQATLRGSVTGRMQDQNKPQRRQGRKKRRVENQYSEETITPDRNRILVPFFLSLFLASLASWRFILVVLVSDSRAGRAFGRRREVEVEVLLLGKADEFPVVGEGAAVAIAEMLENDFPRFANARWHLEQFDEILRA